MHMENGLKKINHMYGLWNINSDNNMRRGNRMVCASRQNGDHNTQSSKNLHAQPFKYFTLQPYIYGLALNAA
jgi:hypothetical protein